MHTGFKHFKLTEDDFDHALNLSFGTFNIQVVSNNESVIAGLQHYFEPYVSELLELFEPRVTVCLYESEKREVPIEWEDWPREEGKTGLKEQIKDVPEGRWIHKFKTGMVFFQHLTMPLAYGSCATHHSQIINFVINQHINFLQQSGGLICHAACLEIQGKGVAIAAYSGGGKSTTMLKLMENTNSKFVSNDRLFLSDHDKGIVAKGVAKQPRVNPGTLLHNARLINVLSIKRQSELAGLPTSQLWALEEKYDVMVGEHYGADCMTPETTLKHVFLLNWQPGISDAVRVEQINIKTRPSMVKAIAKSPGPFFQNEQGHFLESAFLPPQQDYIDKLSKVSVWEVTGGADFDALSTKIMETLF